MDGWDCVLSGSGGGTPAPPSSCPPGYEWDAEHNGCKVAGTKWDDGCFIHTDGKTYCKDNPLPSSNSGSGGGNAGGGTSSSGGGYSAPKYTPTKSPYDEATSKAIYDMITGIMNGTDLPFGPETIARMQAAALQSNKAQLGNSRAEVQKRLINSGLSRSGVAPATYGKLESAAGADLSNNLRQIATNAVQQNYNARMAALSEAQKFLQSERANSLSQDQMLLSYARLNQEWKAMQAGFDQQWKVIQNGDEQAMIRLMLCLRTGTC